jgi:hypothetical protein
VIFGLFEPLFVVYHALHVFLELAVEQVETDRFSCEACGKTYRWKEELAGRRVKCKCGQVMTAPLVGAPPDDLYEMAPEPEKPRPLHQPLTAAAIGESLRASVSAAARTTSPVMAYAGAVRNSAQPDDIENSLGGPLWKTIYIPAAILLIGTVLQIALVTSWRLSYLQFVLPQLGARLGIDLVLSFIGVMLVAKLMGISFGAPGPMTLKLTAIALAVPALSEVIGHVVGHDSAFVAMMTASLLHMPLGAALFWWLFDLEPAEAFYCVIVTWLVNQWALYFLMALIFKS